MKVRKELEKQQESSGSAYIELDTGGKFDDRLEKDRVELKEYLGPPIDVFGGLLLVATELDVRLVDNGYNGWPGHKVIKAGLVAMTEALRTVLETHSLRTGK